MINTEKEYKIQKALGLADAYDLTISLHPDFTEYSLNYPELEAPELEAAVKEHTFESKLIEKVYHNDPIAAIPFITFKFEVKCVHGIVDLINKALPDRPMTMTMTLQSAQGRMNQPRKYHYGS